MEIVFGVVILACMVMIAGHAMFHRPPADPTADRAPDASPADHLH